VNSPPPGPVGMDSAAGTVATKGKRKAGETVGAVKKRKLAGPAQTEPIRTQPRRGKRKSPTAEAPEGLGSASNNQMVEKTHIESAAADPAQTEPIRTQPKRGKRKSPTEDAPEGLGSASNNVMMEQTHLEEAAAPPPKRVRLAPHSEREVTLAADDANVAAGSIDQSGTGPASMPSSLPSSKANPEGKALGNEQSLPKPKRGRGRPPKVRKPVVSGPIPDITMKAADPAVGPGPAPVVQTVGDPMPEVASAPEANKTDTAGSSAGEKPAASAEGPQKITKPGKKKATTGATNPPVKNETAISAASSVYVGKGDQITWRGGLNGPLAIIMAREYDRIINPPKGVGKMGVYREWAAELGVGHVDTDGSKVRKGVTRLKKEFEKALSVMKSGTSDDDALRAICPEFHVLLPVLGGNEAPPSPAPRAQSPKMANEDKPDEDKPLSDEEKRRYLRDELDRVKQKIDELSGDVLDRLYTAFTQEDHILLSI
jgi:hypothetical protein